MHTIHERPAPQYLSDAQARAAARKLAMISSILDERAEALERRRRALIHAPAAAAAIADMIERNRVNARYLDVTRAALIASL